MGDHRQFADFSTEELQAEIKRRQAKKPVPRNSIDWNPVRNVVLYITHCIETDGVAPKDFETMLFQAAMNAVYSEDVWDWWNNKLKDQ